MYLCVPTDTSSQTACLIKASIFICATIPRGPQSSFFLTQKYATFEPLCCLVLVRALNAGDHACLVLYFLLQFKNRVDFCHRNGVSEDRCASIQSSPSTEGLWHQSTPCETQKKQMSVDPVQVYTNEIKIRKFTKSLVRFWVKAERQLNVSLQNGLCYSFPYTHFLWWFCSEFTLAAHQWNKP